MPPHCLSATRRAKAMSSSASVAEPRPTAAGARPCRRLRAPGRHQVMRLPVLCLVPLFVRPEVIEQRLVVHVDGDQHAVSDPLGDGVVGVLGPHEHGSAAAPGDEGRLPVGVHVGELVHRGARRLLARPQPRSVLGEHARRERRQAVAPRVEGDVVDDQVEGSGGRRELGVARELQAQDVSRLERRRLALDGAVRADRCGGSGKIAGPEGPERNVDLRPAGPDVFDQLAARVVLVGPVAAGGRGRPG